MSIPPQKVTPPVSTAVFGQAVSAHRAPMADMAPWIARIHAAQINGEPNQLVSCGLFSDTTVLRVILKGNWHAETRAGPCFFKQAALLFGPHAERMPVSYKGPLHTVAVSLVPGACAALGGPKVSDILNRVLIDGEFGLDGPAMFKQFDPESGPEVWMDVLEDFVRQLVSGRVCAEIEQVTRQFDEAAFANPNIKVKHFASRHDIEAKRLERVIKRDFGLTPKQVLRRARALDMAAHLRGVANPDEAEDLALRYFDQSHLNRDFVALLGMTPTQFVRTPQPLLTLSLEHRQQRRLEALGRAAPDSIKPWQDPPQRINQTAS